MLSTDLENKSSARDPSPCLSFHVLPSSIPNSTSPSFASSSEVDLPIHLPNFSIRDYVLSSRKKDIEKNWPFSLKSLQLCIKHGVNDALPPFQTLETLRHQSLGLHKADNESIEKNFYKNLEDPFAPLNAELSKEKVAEPYLHLRYRDENDIPSTRTSFSIPEIAFTPHKVQSRSGPPKCSTIPKTFTEAKGADPQLINKPQVTSQRLGRKCSLIMKFPGQSSDCSSVLESMASKVCPVCKAFSSSSNTTLNAHIDQCLSTQSTPTWTAGFKSTKHKIKPRKVRLMTDVYSTAEPCTLEDLDLRNGTNWAASRCLTNKESEENTCEIEERRPNETGKDDGSVYIDSNGTKVRILSKLTAPLPPKRSKFAKRKMKRLHTSAVSEMISSEEPKNDQQRAMAVQNDDCATFKQWIRSKRRGVLRKVRYKLSDKSVRCKWHLPQDFLFGVSLKNRGALATNDIEKSLESSNSSSGNSESDGCQKFSDNSDTTVRRSQPSSLGKRKFQQKIDDRIQSSNETESQNDFSGRSGENTNNPLFVDCAPNHSTKVRNRSFWNEKPHACDDIGSGISLKHSFTTVDPIPIPGLRRDMGSEDLQNPSSLISQVDGDSSDSPVSSTISNSDEVRPETVTRVYTKFESMAVPDMSTNLCAEEYFKVAKSPENGFVSYRTHQICCCQRKDSFTHYEGRKRDSYLNEDDCRFLDPEMKMISGSVTDSSSIGRKDRTGANPVLRLMGKNLMIGNKEEESPAAPPERTSNLSLQNFHLQQYQNTSHVPPAEDYYYEATNIPPAFHPCLHSRMNWLSRSSSAIDTECDFVGARNERWQETHPASLNYNPSRVYPKHHAHGELMPVCLPEPPGLWRSCNSEKKHAASSSSSSHHHAKPPSFNYPSGFA